MNIVEDIGRCNASDPEHIAVVDGKNELSYGSLLARVAELQGRLRREGVGPGQRIAFRCRDGAAYILGSLALLGTGAAIVPVDMSMPDEEVQRLLNRMEVNGLLFGKGDLPAASGDQEIGPSPAAAGFLWRPREGAKPLPKKLLDLHPAFIRFSSGTTGASKGVVLSHATIYDRTEAANEALQICRKDRILWVLSMSHHFVVSILLFLRKGATIVIGHRNFPASIFDTAMEGRITMIYASPFHYHLLATGTTVPQQALGNVRLAISTAMKLPAETAEAFKDRFGFYPAEAYGIIEVGLPFIDLTPSRNSLGSVGKMLPAYSLRIDNRPAESVGEVLLRGKGLFDAYISPFRLREEVLEGGWFRTGDLGSLDCAGNLRIEGRKKTVINCAGMKVFPEEVEKVLNSHAAVEESLVYGVEHPVYGQIPEAKIIPAGETTDNTTMIRSLRRHCYAALSSYSVPKRFETVADLPRTTTGKLRRH